MNSVDFWALIEYEKGQKLDKTVQNWERQKTRDLLFSKSAFCNFLDFCLRSLKNTNVSSMKY